MKKFIPAVIALFAAGILGAQENEGKVTYERVSQMQIRINDGDEAMAHQMPRTRTDRFELMFSGGKTLWKAAESDDDQDNMTSSEGGMQIRMVVAGNDDVLFTDLGSGKRVEKREMFDKTFIIDDSVRMMKWKMTGETKEVLNKNCMKATATDIRTRSVMNMENGQMERKEIQDTVNIVAWFTNEIPVATGPAEYQGQLPGLILEMDINNGRQVFKALEISQKVDKSDIKAPEGKKRYTPAEFRTERDKMLDEMQKNNRGGNRVIRMN